MNVDRPGRVPWPPLLLVGALVSGALLQRVAPLHWPPAVAASSFSVPGWMLIGAALLLELTVVRELQRAATTVMPHRAASHLVTGGPFRRSRNPIYVGHVALLVGLGLLLANGWWLVLAPFFAFALDRLAVRPEERHLAARFGEDYRLYSTRVRRWL
jgi:protein-S-isoprenylcysteine O-methyltransferase Ste14